MYHAVREMNSVGRPVYTLYFANQRTHHTGYRYYEGAMKLAALLVGMSYLP